MKTEIKKILYKFLQDGISSDDAAQQVLDLFSVMLPPVTLPDVVKQSELFKCRNVACNEMTNRENGTVFCDKHKPYLGI